MICHCTLTNTNNCKYCYNNINNPAIINNLIFSYIDSKIGKMETIKKEYAEMINKHFWELL
jgi:hypothetical protein